MLNAKWLLIFLLLGLANSTALRAQKDTISASPEELKTMLRKINKQPVATKETPAPEVSAKPVKSATPETEQPSHDSEPDNSAAMAAFYHDLIVDAIFLVRQEYQAVSDGKEITRDGQEYFNFLVGVGIRMDDKLVVPTKLSTPWTFDPVYAKTKDTNDGGVLINPKIKALSADEFSEMSSLSYSTASDGSIAFLNFQEGNPIDLSTASREANGVLLLLYADDDNDVDAKPQYKFVETTLAPSGDEKLTFSKVTIPKNCFGGVFFEKDISAGPVSLKASGLAEMEGSSLLFSPIREKAFSGIVANKQQGAVSKKKDQDKESSRGRGRESSRSSEPKTEKSREGRVSAPRNSRGRG